MIIIQESNPVTLSTSFMRRIDERTHRVEIYTARSPEGVAGYYALAYREQIEYRDDVLYEVTELPALRMPITQEFYVIMATIADTIDACAIQGRLDGTWPATTPN